VPKRVENQAPPNPVFSMSSDSWYKWSTPVVFWGEKRPWVECGGSIRKHLVPKFELDFCPAHWGSPLGLKLHETSSYVIKYELHRKKTCSGLLLRRPPLKKYSVFTSFWVQPPPLPRLTSYLPMYEIITYVWNHTCVEIITYLCTKSLPTYVWQQYLCMESLPKYLIIACVEFKT